MAVTTNQGLILADGTDNANVPLAMTDYNTNLENRLVQRYLSIADRTARNALPFEGELSYLSDLNRYEQYTGSAWISLIPSAVSMFEGSVVVSASVAYTTVGGPVVGASVIVPPSGSIKVSWSAGLDNSAAGITFSSIQVNAGSVIGAGATLVAVADTWALFMTGSELRTSTFHVFTGLAPGAVVNAFMMHRVSSDTGTYTKRIVEAAQY
jgi:hypothetical protein